MDVDFDFALADHGHWIATANSDEAGRTLRTLSVFVVGALMAIDRGVVRLQLPNRDCAESVASALEFAGYRTRM
jgi:hypothetical protein